MTKPYQTKFRRIGVAGSVLMSLALSIGIDPAGSGRPIKSILFGDIQSWPEYFYSFWPLNWLAMLAGFTGCFFILEGALLRAGARSDRIRAQNITPLRSVDELTGKEFCAQPLEILLVAVGSTACFFLAVITAEQGWYIGLECGLFGGVAVGFTLCFWGGMLWLREKAATKYGVGYSLVENYRWLKKQPVARPFRALAKWFSPANTVPSQSNNRPKSEKP